MLLKSAPNVTTRREVFGCIVARAASMFRSIQSQPE
jgi:hypothetical protein